ncbi:MAG: WG repeat-containing protein [bacterium]
MKPSEVSLFPVEIGGKWGFGDKEAHIVIEPKFDLRNWFSEGLAAVMVGN